MSEKQTLEEMTQKVKALSIELESLRKKEKDLKEAENYYRSFFEHGPDGIVILDPETARIIDFNDQACRQLGYSRQEFAQLKVFDVEARETVQETKSHIKKILKNRFDTFETLQRTKNGEIRNIHVASNVFTVDEQQIYHCIWRDITSQKQAEASLRDSEKKYRDLVENIGEVIYSVDRDGILTYISPVCEKIVGYKPEEIIGKSVMDLVFEDDREQIRQDYQNVFSDENVPSEYRLVGKSGDIVWVRSFSRPAMEDGKVMGINGVITDVSALKKSQEEKQALEKQLNQSHKMEALGTLASGIAHDFNNILSPINGFAEMILMEIGEDSPFRERLLQILDCVKRGSNLTRQILAFSRKVEPEIKPLDVNKLFSEVLQFLRPTIPSAIQIDLDSDENVGYVMADATQIHQVLMNLITNACHAMEDDTGFIHMTLRNVELVSSDALCKKLKPGPYVCLSVSDSGSGIGEDIKDRIFDPYFTTKDKDKGTGLGLANVLGIINSHNGHIAVESELGKGTTFCIYLPRVEKISSGKNIKKMEELQRGSESILVVDDEQYIATVLQGILEKLGYKVTAITSSHEALDLFKKDPFSFDVIITDMTMPQMTGVHLSKEILAIRNDIPIILCTGYSDKIDVANLKAMGIKGFMLKPIELAVLADAVRKVLDENETSYENFS